MAKVVDKEITGVDLIPLKDDVEQADQDVRRGAHAVVPGGRGRGRVPARRIRTATGRAGARPRRAPSRPTELESQHFKGYAAGDIVGHDGLEWTYDKWLRGRDGVAKVEVDAQGHPKQGASVPGGRMAQTGDTLVTTIDSKVQAAAEQALRTGISLAHSDGAVRRQRRRGGRARRQERATCSAWRAIRPTTPDLFVGGISTKEYKKLTQEERELPHAQPPHPGDQGRGLDVQAHHGGRRTGRGRHHAGDDRVVPRLLHLARRT